MRFWCKSFIGSQFIYDFFDSLKGTLTPPPETEENFTEVLDEVERGLRMLDYKFSHAQTERFK